MNKEEILALQRKYRREQSVSGLRVVRSYKNTKRTLKRPRKITDEVWKEIRKNILDEAEGLLRLRLIDIDRKINFRKKCGNSILYEWLKDEEKKISKDTFKEINDKLKYMTSSSNG